MKAWKIPKFGWLKMATRISSNSKKELEQVVVRG